MVACEELPPGAPEAWISCATGSMPISRAGSSLICASKHAGRHPQSRAAVSIQAQALLQIEFSAIPTSLNTSQIHKALADYGWPFSMRKTGQPCAMNTC